MVVVAVGLHFQVGVISDLFRNTKVDSGGNKEEEKK
jgi:hypothetical protein